MVTLCLLLLGNAASNWHDRGASTFLAKGEYFGILNTFALCAVVQKQTSSHQRH